MSTFICFVLYISNPFILSLFLSHFKSTEYHLKGRSYKGKNINIESLEKGIKHNFLLLVSSPKASFPGLWPAQAPRVPGLRRAPFLRLTVLLSVLNQMAWVDLMGQCARLGFESWVCGPRPSTDSIAGTVFTSQGVTLMHTFNRTSVSTHTPFHVGAR